MADSVNNLNPLLQNIAKRMNVHYCACTFLLPMPCLIYRNIYRNISQKIISSQCMFLSISCRPSPCWLYRVTMLTNLLRVKFVFLSLWILNRLLSAIVAAQWNFYCEMDPSIHFRTMYSDHFTVSNINTLQMSLNIFSIGVFPNISSWLERNVTTSCNAMVSVQM